MNPPPPITLHNPSHPCPRLVPAKTLKDLYNLLASQTKTLETHPYSPQAWLARAETLRELQYPELAAGDAWKAKLLLQTRLAKCDRVTSSSSDESEGRSWRTGFQGGWMMMTMMSERASEQDETAGILELMRRASTLLPGAEVGQAVYYRPRAYPWVSVERSRRGCGLVAGLQGEFDRVVTPTSSDRGGYCEVRRDAFGTGDREVWGVFARRDVLAREVVLVDGSSIWGRGREGVDKNGGTAWGDDREDDGSDWSWEGVGEGLAWFRKFWGVWKRGLAVLWGWIRGRGRAMKRGLGFDSGWTCEHRGESPKQHSASGHPDIEQWERAGLQNAAEKDAYEWILETSDIDAADVILRCKMLEASYQTGCEHPLDYTLVARLTPTYHPSPSTTNTIDTNSPPLRKPHTLNLTNDIAIPLAFLSRNLGMDIFSPANSAYTSPHILFTLAARLENNIWSDVLTSCLSPLFCIFNHSCEPNISWEQPRRDDAKGELVVRMVANRDIVKGEQLFVAYDGFCLNEGWRGRMKRLGKWLAGGCGCGRCVREMELEKGMGYVSVDSEDYSAAWDDDRAEDRLPHGRRVSW
ncbi:hypothetical protein MBLNU230_g8525t1 [Neophaeotheca triangularis]